MFAALRLEMSQVEAAVMAQDSMSVPSMRLALAAKMVAWFLWLQERISLKAMKVLP